jgi:ADP-ribosylglycohydrolase/fructose-1,6-bisphosphatase/inositol monophosphatase family enzyme
MPVNLNPVLAGVIAAVELEGKHLQAEFFRRKGPRGSHAKAPIDTEIEIRLLDALQALVPCPFIGEETGWTGGALDDWVWLVDPHDGTREFLAGRRGSCISVALLRGVVPVLGVVHAPLAPDRGPDTVAWAQGCGPLLRNGEPLQVDLSRRRVACGEWIWATASSAFRPELYSEAVAPARYIALPSIAYRLARVAAGDGIGTLSIHSVNEYDIAAGVALVCAAGGVVLDADRQPIALLGTPGAQVSGCFAGAPEAAQQLARFDWSLVQKVERKPPRVELGFPRPHDETRLARAQGCLLGQVIGDSLGSLVEFRSAANIAGAWPKGLRDLADGGTWNTIAGQPTDDSELALALARMLSTNGRYESALALQAYRAWMESEPFDMGNTTRLGLVGEADFESQSNGSLMRVSPLGIHAAGDPGRAAAAARQDSALTHPHAACVESCAAYASAIAQGIGGGGREAMFEAALAYSSGAAREAIERAAAGEGPSDYESKPGWVLVALQNAFYQLARARSFEEGLTATVNAGGDTDTNGAIAGALLGALYGRDAVPRRWILPVLACRPVAEAGAARPRPMHYWPDDVLELAEAILAHSIESGSLGR